MKKKVLPVVANFSLIKKQRKEVPFPGAPLFLGKIYGKYFIGTVFLKKNIFTNHIKQDIMQSKQRKTTYKTKKNNKNK